jgi:hypothetical protein
LVEKLLDLERNLIENPKSEDLELNDFRFKFFDKFFQDFSPEIGKICQFQEDETKNQLMKTGLLQEKRILGIFLKSYLEGITKMTTRDVINEYKSYFENVARSTISLYLNILNKESVLCKEKKGRVVYYNIFDNPPRNIPPFWFTRIFCIIPVYFNRANYFSDLYNKAKEYIQQYFKKFSDEDQDILMHNFKFILGLILLKIFKNRIQKCMYCQFSKKKTYAKMEYFIDLAIKDRSDFLSKDIFNGLIPKCSEIAIFNGININSEFIKENLVEELLRITNINKEDLKFQREVFYRRKNIRG